MKNDRYQSLLITLFLLICLLAPQAARAAEKHFLWRATADTSTVYLLGSIHVMKRDAYPLSTVIERAFDESDTLAVEADINNVGHGTLKMLRRAGFYDPNDSLANHITRHTDAYVAEDAARLGLPAPVLNRHKPWFLGITMSSMELMRSGYDMKYGIDKYFLTRASGRKKIVELESMEYQVDLLASLPESEQESFLLYTTKDLRSIGEQVDALMAAWNAGDGPEITRLNAEFLASRESAELRAETAQMGFSLARLVRDLRDPSLADVAARLAGLPEIAFPTGWAGIAAAWQIAPEAAVGAYLWSWAENQVMAALKAVPLGQASGQRLLASLGTGIPATAVAATVVVRLLACGHLVGTRIRARRRRFRSHVDLLAHRDRERPGVLVVELKTTLERIREQVQNAL